MSNHPHRDVDAVADGPSTASFLHTLGGPRHRADLTDQEQLDVDNEEVAYRNWCLDSARDPDETQSMVAYEHFIGWLFIDDEPAEDHR